MLRRLGAARGRVPDTYVPKKERRHLSVCMSPPQHIVRAEVTNDDLFLFLTQPSVKATSPARRTRCASGLTNAAVAMDTLELAVTRVRFSFF